MSTPIIPSTIKPPLSLQTTPSPSLTTTPSKHTLPNTITTTPTPTPTPTTNSTPGNKSQQTVPYREYEQVLTKLKLLESKLAEQRSFQTEKHRLLNELEASNLTKSKMAFKLQELHSELKSLKESQRGCEKSAEQIQDLSEQLELATLDKEVAEEKVEQLEHDMQVLRETVEEMKIENEVLKEENAILQQENITSNGDGNPAATPSERATVEMVQLTRQNERLKEALIKLRDMATETETQFRKKVQSLERENAHYTGLQQKHQILQTSYQTMESNLELLKQQLDDQLGSETLLEQLTEKNLSLGEKIEELEATIDDLEALKELNDELESSHVETEKQLQEEIDIQNALLGEYEKRLERANEQMADYETTISQFRELVKTLQSDLESVRKEHQTTTAQSSQLSSQTQHMMSVNLQLQSTVLKQQSKAVELELRKLDSEQKSLELAMMKPFLPDAFGAENDAIQVMLMLKRIMFKSELLIKFLSEKANQAGLGGHHSNDEKRVVEETLVHANAHFKLLLISCLGKRFVTVLSECSPEAFLAFGKMGVELVGSERRLDTLIELVKKDELDLHLHQDSQQQQQHTVLNELSKCQLQLEYLSKTFLPTTLDSVPSRASDATSAIISGMGVLVGSDLDVSTVALMTYFVDYSRGMMTLLDAEFAKLVYELSCMSKINGLDEEEASKIGKLVGWMEKIRGLIASHVRVPVKKLHQILTEAVTKSLFPNTVYVEKLCATVFTPLGRILEFAQSLSSSFESLYKSSASTTTMSPSTKSILVQKLTSTIYTTTETFFNIQERSVLEGLRNVLESVVKDILSIVSEWEVGIEDVGLARFVMKSFGLSGSEPWSLRAEVLKSAQRNHQVLENAKNRLDEQVKILVQELKIKEDRLGEAVLKIDVLEKRMDSVRQNTSSVSVLEDALTKSKLQEKAYEEALENLQADMEKLEQDNARLKKYLKRFEQAASGGNSNVSGATRTRVPSSSLSTSSSLNSLELESFVPVLASQASAAAAAGVVPEKVMAQIESLRTALYHLRRENARLKTLQTLYSFGKVFMESDALGTRCRQWLVWDGKMKANGRGDEMRSLVDETKVLVKELHAHTSSPRVVDLSKYPTRKADSTTTSTKLPTWTSLQNDPRVQLHSRQTQTFRFESEIHNLLSKLNNMGYNENRNQNAKPGNVLDSVTTNDKPKLDFVKFASVTVPNRSKNAGVVRGETRRRVFVENVEQLRTVQKVLVV